MLRIEAQDLLRAPSILLRSKPVGESSIAIRSFEGKVGAVVFEGSHFVTSPNMDYVPLPPRNPRMSYKVDRHLGDDDFLLWPQPYLAYNCHYAAVPRRPANLDPSSDHFILFYDVIDNDFVPLREATLAGLGHISHERLSPAKKIAMSLNQDNDNYQKNEAFIDKIPNFQMLTCLINRTIVHLSSLPMTRRQALFLFTELQRYMLEFIAVHKYMHIYKPRMEGLQPPATMVEDVVGAFVRTAADAENFFLAGLPVWVVRPAELAGSIRVDSLVEPRSPRLLLCLDDASAIYPVTYKGPPTSLLKYKTFQNFARNIVSYSTNFSAPETLSAPDRNLQHPRSLQSSPSDYVRERPKPVIFYKNPTTKSNGGRNKFLEPSNPIIPPPIPVWRDALQKVNTDPGRRAANLNMGYILPDPGLFAGVNSEEKQALFISNWLRHRPSLIFRLTSSKPLSNQLWRDLLNSSLSRDLQKPTTPGTKANSRQNVIQTILADCLQSENVKLNLQQPDTVFWQEQQLQLGPMPSTEISHEILWELFELNFRFEFLALDHCAHIPCSTSHSDSHIPQSREDLLLQCFPGATLGASLFHAPLHHSYLGLAAEGWRDRAPHIIAMKNVMKTWQGFSNACKDCLDLVTDWDVLDYSETEIKVLESSLAHFYTQSFDFFGRAAIVPHCLKIVVSL